MSEAPTQHKPEHVPDSAAQGARTPSVEEALHTQGGAIQADSAGAVSGYRVEFRELTLQAQASRIVEVLTTLRDNPHYRFVQLVDLTAVDHPERARRFDVVYHLMSFTQNVRVRVKLEIEEDRPVPTATTVYPNANWYEREVFDLFGVSFEGHPDLRRILTDYGFVGHPLRKDFPMSGHVELRYDEVQKRVVYEPVKLSAEFRPFDFMSPWEGVKYVIPGDEKATQLGGGQGGAIAPVAAPVPGAKPAASASPAGAAAPTPAKGGH